MPGNLKITISTSLLFSQDLPDFVSSEGLDPEPRAPRLPTLPKVSCSGLALPSPVSLISLEWHDKPSYSEDSGKSKATNNFFFTVVWFKV